MRFCVKYRPCSYRDWYFQTSRTPEFPTTCAIFGRNWAPIAIAIGIFRRLSRPSFRRHVRFLSKFGPYSYRDWNFRRLGRPSFRSHVRFLAKFGPYSYLDWDFRRRDRASFRRHVRFWGKFGPYSYRDWDFLTSGPPEFPDWASFDTHPARKNFATFYTLSHNRVRRTIRKMRKSGKIGKNDPNWRRMLSRLRFSRRCIHSSQRK